MSFSNALIEINQAAQRLGLREGSPALFEALVIMQIAREDGFDMSLALEIALSRLSDLAVKETAVA